MENDIKAILFSEEAIQKRVRELGEQISRDYAGKPLVLVGTLKGSFMFLADLARSVNMECEFQFVSASSYGFSSYSSGKVKIGAEFEVDFVDRDVVLVEDILDSGNTLTALKEFITTNCNPKSLKTCTFLDKPARREKIITADYTGFICPDEFVVGYGLDFGEKYRNLPYVAILKPEIFAEII
jgi:hypoxanthine phosphoribosyltransferase